MCPCGFPSDKHCPMEAATHTNPPDVPRPGRKQNCRNHAPGHACKARTWSAAAALTRDLCPVLFFREGLRRFFPSSPTHANAHTHTLSLFALYYRQQALEKPRAGAATRSPQIVVHHPSPVSRLRRLEEMRWFVRGTPGAWVDACVFGMCHGVFSGSGVGAWWNVDCSSK